MHLRKELRNYWEERHLVLFGGTCSSLALNLIFQSHWRDHFVLTQDTRLERVPKCLTKHSHNTRGRVSEGKVVQGGGVASASSCSSAPPSQCVGECGPEWSHLPHAQRKWKSQCFAWNLLTLQWIQTRCKYSGSNKLAFCQRHCLRGTSPRGDCWPRSALWITACVIKKRKPGRGSGGSFLWTIYRAAAKSQSILSRQLPEQPRVRAHGSAGTFLNGTWTVSHCVIHLEAKNASWSWQWVQGQVWILWALKLIQFGGTLFKKKNVTWWISYGRTKRS